MTNHVGLTEEYLHKMHAEVTSVIDRLSAGHCKTFEEYRERVGYIKGLKEAERILHETIKMYMELQDYDD